MPASLYTHVMCVPDDGIRRTGRSRVRIRLERHLVPAVVGPDCRCKECRTVDHA